MTLLEEIPRPPIQCEIVADIKKLLKKFATFEADNQRLWDHYNEVVYCYCDMELHDLIELLKVFSDFAG